MLRQSVFFFQAEDGIRDYKVTGVQTCALPISAGVAGRDYRVCDDAELARLRRANRARVELAGGAGRAPDGRAGRGAGRERSEERRVGEEWRSRWWPYHYKKKNTLPQVRS